MNQTFQKLLPFIEKENAYNTALILLSWDTETLAPKAADTLTAKAVGLLSEESYHALVNDEVISLVEQLSGEEERGTLTDTERSIVHHIRKNYEKLSHIPPEEYREYAEFCATAQHIYCHAKQTNNYEEYMPVLEKMIDYTRRFASYRAGDKENIYDLLLEEYEPGFTQEVLDEFFARLRKELVPLIKKVSAKNDLIDKSYNFRNFPLSRQKKMCDFLVKYIGFDFNRGVVAETEHPFTTSLHNRDVRITNHFYKNNLESAIFSVIHEGGHALYEMGISDEVTQTPAAAITMGMHESQSRFYENLIGRSKAFWTPIYPRLQKTFDAALADVSLTDFIRGINKAEPGLIRTEADELTYPLHIMIRYELEKKIIAGECDIKELPSLWNEMYQKYLGVTPKNDTEGILQDIHWAMGNFGYFPSYALGSAIASQIYAFMEKELPVKQLLEEGNLTAIRAFLQEHVHQYGAVYTTNTLLKRMTGEEFNPQYYINYLKEKYTKLYQL